MSISITTILGTDAFSGSRVVINANFEALKNEVENIESVFGLSLTSGNLDVSSATGGQIKGKIGAFDSIQLPSTGTANITLTGSTGAMVAETLSLGTSITVPTATIDDLTMTSLGSSTFNGEATFNALLKVRDGFAMNKVDVGAVATHEVVNDDCIVIFEPASLSPAGLVLTASASLVDGHVVTLIDKSNGFTVLDSSNIVGFSSGSITFSGGSYKSSITLMYILADDEWMIIGSSNMTIV